MYSLRRAIRVLAFVLALALTLGVTPAFAGLELVINGKVISTNVIVERDPMSMRMFRLAGWAEETRMVLAKTAGGAMPVQGLEGRVGEVLSDGRWRFQVLSVQTADSYNMKTDAEPYDYANLSSFDSIKRTFTPKAGYTLVVIQCRATNAQKSNKRLWVAASDSSNVRTALADVGGSSHVPIAYDFEGGPIQTKPLQPDETITFPVVFSVPQSAQLKELIFTLAANGEREQSKDVHVSLSAEQKDSASETNNSAGDPDQKANDVTSAAAGAAGTNDTVMNSPSSAASLAPTLSGGPVAPKKPGVVRIGIVKPKIQLGASDAAGAANASEAVRNSFAEYLNGPTLEVVLLTSRVTAQALAEAKQSECDYVLFTALALKKAGEGSNPFGKALGDIASSSTANIGDAAVTSVSHKAPAASPDSSAAGSSAADSSASDSSVGSAARSSGRNAAVTGIQTLRGLAGSIQAKDEFRLEYRLLPATGAAPVLEKTEKIRKDGKGQSPDGR